MIAPKTKVRLLKAPFELNYNNELTFNNINSQTNYFLSLPFVEMDECSYQRKEERIRFDKVFDDLVPYNYCMYQNEEYSNKWFYAFINKVEYVDDETSYVYITTDVFQTWMFEYNMKASYVEREHVSDDTVGIHTIDEGLETGDYISNGIMEYKEDVSPNSLDNVICFACSDLPNAIKNDFTPSGINQPRVLNRIYGGLYIVGLPTVLMADLFIEGMNKENMLDAIVNVFMIPIWIKNLSSTITTQVTVNQIVIDILLFNNPQTSYEANIFSVNTPTSLNGYVPKNNKLLVYPYSLFTVSNLTGTEVEFKYEDFTNMNDENNKKFIEYGSISGGGYSGKLIPCNYKNISNNYDYGIEKGKLPTCSWTGDAYTNWLSANAINLGMSSFVGAFGGLVGGARVLGGDIKGAENLVDSFGTVLETQIKKAEAKRMPDTLNGSVNSADINYSSYHTGYILNKLTLKEEYLKQIDSFFSMFGYKVNELKIPNLFSRRNWNFIKCLNVNLIGDIPQDDMQELKNIFNNGVTLWHNPNTFLDYSQNNDII